MRAELARLAALPVPISVAQAAQRLSVDRRHLYLQANKEARILGERWKRYVCQATRGFDPLTTSGIDPLG
jgi:hypothetical protein